MPATTDITVYRGEDVTLNYTMDPVEDVTGWTLVFTLKIAKTSPVLSSIPGGITDGPGGRFFFIVPSAATDIVAQTYVYDVVRTDPGADKVLAIGKFIIKSGVRTP